jgi:hypothetical protein
MSRPRALVLLAGALIAVCPPAARARAAATSDPISLYYKAPEKQPLVYASVMSEEVNGKDAKGHPETSTFRVEQTITNRYKLVGPDVLAIKAQFSDHKTTVNGKEVAYTPPDKEAQRLMDVKGYRKTANKGAADFEKIDVILPGTKVKVGDTWNYIAPPTTDLPIFLVTKYTLVGFEKVNGRDVARIEATTHASELEPVRRLTITFHAKGRILFAHREGILVSSEFNIRMVTEPEKAAKYRVTKSIRSSMKLVRAGS